MKEIIKATKGYKKYALMSPILMIIEALIEVFIPTITKDIIDIGIQNSDYNFIWQRSVLMIILAIISFISGVGAGFFATRASAGVGKNIRKALYDKIQTFSFEDIDKFSTASLITRLTTDVSNVQASFQMTIRICFRAPILFISTLIMAYIAYPSFANIYAIAAPIMLSLVCLATFPAIKLFRQMFTKYDKMNLISEENINAIRTVKAYNTQQREIDKFVQASKETRNIGFKADILASFANPISSSSIYVCSILISYLGAMLIFNDSSSSHIGLVSMMINYGTTILMSLTMVTGISIMLFMSKASLDRIHEVFIQEPSIVNPSNPLTEVKNGDVEFDHVYFSYSKNDVMSLKDITFKAKQGDIIGIFGPTGSSKTTLISLIARLYDVSQGQVKLGDEDVRKYDLVTLRDAVGVVLQKNTLFSGTIRSNMLWGNQKASDDEIYKALELAQAKDFVIEKGGLDCKVEEEGTNFSGGQKQRLCIARALLKSPKVLILDDSTSAVDTKTDASIRQAFKTYIPTTTKIIISQRISSLMFADNILLLKDGELVEQGNHNYLLKNSKYYQEIFNAQAKSSAKLQEEK